MALKRNFVTFVQAADDGHQFPSDQFLGFSVTDADEATISFKAVDGSQDNVNIKLHFDTTCAERFKNACKVMASILAGARKYSGKNIIVADDLNKVYFNELNLDHGAAITSIA